MKISIITPCFNSESTIEDTIQSVLKQDYPFVEYIIIDGRSADNTSLILEKYKSGISKVVSEKDNGIYDAMNKGIKLATGEIIGILNSDDFYVDSKVLSKVADTFSNSHCDATYSDLQYVSKNDTTKLIRNWISGDFKKSKFKWGWMPPHPTFFLKKELYLKNGVYNDELSLSADYELMLRMLCKFKLSPTYIPEVLVKMRIGGKGNSSVYQRVKANMEDRKAWKLNDLTPNIFTFYLKPLRKIFQYLN